MSTSSPGRGRTIGRYAIFGEIAAGGMATVHLGRLVGPSGFSRPVAIKRLHPQFARDRDFVDMFLDEARIAARIHHPNVVSTLDVINEGDELLLVMDYVSGESLARLLREVRVRRETVPPRIAAAIMVAVLHGLHAAHEARDVRGEPLAVVHRDVSPQNILVGGDGVPRVLDFGVAKATGRAHSTGAGHVKGKLAYMAPEQLRGVVSPRTDLFAASIVLWETLTTRRLFTGDHEGEIIEQVSKLEIVPPSQIVDGVPPALEEIVMRGLEREPDARWSSAQEMARALEERVPLATTSEVAAWVNDLAGDTIRARRDRLAELESDPGHVLPEVLPRPPEVETSPLHAAVVDAEPPPRRRARTTLLLAVAVALLLGLGGAFAALRREPPKVTASAPSVSAISSAPSTTTSASTVSVSEPSVSAPPAVPSPSPPPLPKPVAKPVVTKPRVSCDPPYVRTAEGKLVPKPGCL